MPADAATPPVTGPGPPGPWSPWWCRAHFRVEDPGAHTPARVCGECGHVYPTADDLTACPTLTPMPPAPPVTLCGQCLTPMDTGTDTTGL